MELAKALVRPPFANYDLVVYFGCGLFALPFLQHYVLEPLAVPIPSIAFTGGGNFTTTLVATLTILMFVYIIGHGVAYLGSQLIEKTADAFLGKTSSIVLLSSKTNANNRNLIIRGHILKKFGTAVSRRSWFSSLVRGAFHLPVLLPYFALGALGVFGFYSSRVPRYVVATATKNLQGYIPEARVSLGSSWFKTLEGVILNNNAPAAARMYNYLIISGLFRSTSLILLSAIWMELYYTAHNFMTGHDHIPEWSTHGPIHPSILTISALVIFYFFSLFSYLKFQRRYVEEAIFALALTKT